MGRSAADHKDVTDGNRIGNTIDIMDPLTAGDNDQFSKVVPVIYTGVIVDMGKHFPPHFLQL